MNAIEVAKLDWEKGAGLIPAVVQHAQTALVLMLGYMDRAALQKTLDSGRVTFFSRTKQRLWTKGETSGNALLVVSIAADCDQDALLIQAEPSGPVCHKGTATCFGDAPESSSPGLAFLEHLQGVIDRRIAERPEGSYTARLASEGPLRIAQKFGEEAQELMLAAVAQDDERVASEAADTIFHLLVLLRARKLTLNEVARELERRHRT